MPTLLLEAPLDSRLRGKDGCKAKNNQPIIVLRTESQPLVRGRGGNATPILLPPDKGVGGLRDWIEWECGLIGFNPPSPLVRGVIIRYLTRREAGVELCGADAQAVGDVGGRYDNRRSVGTGADKMGVADGLVNLKAGGVRVL